MKWTAFILIHVTSVMLALTLAGCMMALDESAEVEVDGLSEPLVSAGGNWWTNNGHVIPMCWHLLDDFASDADKAAAQTFVQQTIQEGWINLLDLRTTWTSCPTAGSERHVRVKLRIGDEQYNGTTLTAGMATLSDAAQRLVPVPNDPPGLLMGFRADWNRDEATRANFRSLILHEFGHVLGFGHEQERPDGPPDVACYSHSVANAITIGPPDPSSIMGWSYCTEALGALSPADVRAARSVYGVGRSGSNDFNNDGRADILWHNAATGASEVWFMSGASRIGRATVGDSSGPLLVGPPWVLVGSQDFNADRQTDLLWHNASTGETKVWLMNGERLAAAASVLAEDGSVTHVGPPWSIVSTNDFNADGGTDILWHNASTGETQVWLMGGLRVAQRVTVVAENGSAIFVGPPWSIVSTNDFNRDGFADILWHNASSGESQVWLLTGARIASRMSILDENGQVMLVGVPWSVVGTNDFNQDGAADILWHNESTGEIQMWLMNGGSIARRVTVDAVLEGGGALVGLPWSIVNH